MLCPVSMRNGAAGDCSTSSAAMLPSRNADRAKPAAGKTTWPNLQLLKTISDSNTLNHTVFTQGEKSRVKTLDWHVGPQRWYTALADTLLRRNYTTDKKSESGIPRGWNGYRLKSQHRKKVDPGEKNSPAVPAGIRTRDLSITSLTA